MSAFVASASVCGGVEPLDETRFWFACCRRAAQVPDGVRVRGLGADAVVRQQQRGDQPGARQLRPLLHHHLQRARRHRLERQLHVAPLPPRPPLQVRSPRRPRSRSLSRLSSLSLSRSRCRLRRRPSPSRSRSRLNSLRSHSRRRRRSRSPSVSRSLSRLTSRNLSCSRRRRRSRGVSRSLNRLTSRSLSRLSSRRRSRSRRSRRSRRGSSPAPSDRSDTSPSRTTTRLLIGDRPPH